MSTVVVTGGSGFVGAHVILQLLSAGHEVRTTVRSLKREGDVHAMLKAGGQKPGDRLSFFAADLVSDAGWREAVAGCDYVMHVASPIPGSAPKARGRVDHSSARRHSTGFARGARREGKAGCADIVLRRGLLWSSAAECAVRRNK